ncbi:LysR family transcriptional regulator [Mobilitalea sibirica]|uniref:LysR family transcriptional regulator n=1 Tax=Mobilitalea sibirica TaxID=1462919 RepID=A0A8J7GXP8_9FIRM|nr:LysR family transcriptional regulator [Mobilitalea sibirica]MBH1940044.1 LysR family transcriptional regulator [Mobilitalea sibirica]
MEQNLSLYHVFLSVAQSGNISHAAKLLYISQPAVSKAITNLEENLKTTLFVRSSRGVKLTEEGSILYEHVKKAFDLLTMGEERLQRIRELGIGHLRIGVSSTLCKYLLLPYLNVFVKENPHIKITIESQSSYHTIKQLENHTLDIGLVAKPSSSKAFHFYSLGEIEDIFVATPGYLDNLMLREKAYDIFSSANIMLLDKENVSRKYIDDYFKENSIEPKHILEVSNMDLLIEFAKTGLGIACVIRDFVTEELKQGTLVQIPLQIPVNKREVGFAYAKSAFLSNSILKFIKFTQKRS